LLVGGRVHIVDDNDCRDPLELRRSIEREGVTIFETVPALLRAMLEIEVLSQTSGHDLNSLQWLLVTGEALPPDLCRLWLQSRSGIPMLNAYGPTECSDDVTHHVISKLPDPDMAVMPVGRPVGNIKIHILDENLQPTPFGMPGEVCVGGIGVGRGYLKDSLRTALAFRPDPHAVEPGDRLYKTGDLGRYLADGTIEFLGRIDHQVKIRGYRIELGEIEARLLEHPAVHEAVVVAHEIAPGDKRLTAYLSLHQAESATVKELRSYLEEKLPKYMVPATFVILDSLPLTANGKVDRKALPEPGSERPEVDGSFVAPLRPVEEMLASIWRKLLHIEQVGSNDNFFELGGDSILAVQVAVSANQMGLRLAPMDIFERQTIAELADWLSRHSLVRAEQGLVEGPVIITPSQKRLLESSLDDVVRHSTTVIVDLQPDADPHLLEQAMQQLMLHHDALRIRFTRDTNDWQQFNSATDEGRHLATVDLSHLAESDHPLALESVIAGIQADVDLLNGPVMQSAFIRFGSFEPSRLLIAVHPLVADDASLHILLTDLNMAYQQLSLGETVQLPLKSTSFKQWSEKLDAYSQSEALDHQIDYWLTELQTEAPTLPFDISDGENNGAGTDTVSISVAFDEIELPGGDPGEPPALQWSNLSLAALARVIARWSGSDHVLIDLHHNPRMDAIKDIDLSRTVGPLTTTYPISLKVEDAEEPIATLRSLHQKLEQVPDYGMSYGILRFLDTNQPLAQTLRLLPSADIAFSYLDQSYSLTLESSLFDRSKEDGSALKCRQTYSSYSLEVSGCLAGGRLHFGWRFDPRRFNQSTIESLASGFVEELRNIIVLSLSVKEERSAESKMAEFNWDKQDLDKVISLIGRDEL